MQLKPEVLPGDWSRTFFCRLNPTLSVWNESIFHRYCMRFASCKEDWSRLYHLQIYELIFFRKQKLRELNRKKEKERQKKERRRDVYSSDDETYERPKQKPKKEKSKKSTDFIEEDSEKAKKRKRMKKLQEKQKREEMRARASKANAYAAGKPSSSSFVSDRFSLRFNNNWWLKKFFSQNLNKWWLSITATEQLTLRLNKLEGECLP